MSNLKKVVSLLLCLSMLVGVFTVLGGTLAPTASAVKLDELPAEPVINKVKTVQELNAEYGDKGYYYLGLEFYEADGKLTDGYVNAGDELTVKFYVKSSYYVYKVATNYAFDRNFFDISNGNLAKLTYDTTANLGNNAQDDGTNNTGIKYPTEGTASGKSYYYKTNLAAASVNGVKLKYTIKTLWAGNDSNYFTDASTKNGTTTAASSRLGIDLATVRSWDLIEISNLVRTDSTKKGVILNSDEPILEYKINVRDDLADGTTGDTTLRIDMFRIYDHVKGDSNTYRKGDVTLAKEEETTTVQMKDAAFYSDYVNIDNFDFADCNNTFVVGTNPVPEGKFFARFVDNDSEVITTAYYAEGEDITLPATREGFVGWANLATGAVEEGTSLKMPASNVTYKAVYSTDKFKVTLDCDGGKIGENEKVEVELSYNQTLDLSQYVPTKEHATFATWNPSTFTLNNINETTVTAVWAETEYTIKFMLMDYATGEWFLYDTKTGKYSDTPIDKAKITAVTPEQVNWNGSLAKLVKTATLRDEEGTFYKPAEVYYDADKTYYIQTKLVYDVTLKIPEFDNTTFTYTDNYTDVALQVEADYNTGLANVILSGANANVNSPSGGYSFDGWYDADGNKAADATVKTNGAQFSLTADKGSAVTYYARYSSKEYKVRFDYRDTTTFAYWENTIKVGDVLDFSEGKITYTSPSSGKITELVYPKVGVESSEQEGTNLWRDPGYMLNGWYLKSYTNRESVNDKTVLTAEMIEKYVTKDELTVYGDWEALVYNLEFYYMTEESFPNYVETPYKVEPLAVGTNIGAYTQSEAAEKAALNEIAPVGRYFDFWENKNENSNGNTINYMVKGGLKLYGRYDLKQYPLYIDYNNGHEVPIKEYGFGTRYETDLEFQDPNVDSNRGPGVSIRKLTISESEKPGTDYVHIGWKVFYLDDAADISDPTKWHEGYNNKGDGSTKLYGPVIYQAQWLPYSELFFRTYDTNGDLYSVLTKNFKRYYWHYDYPCDKEQATLNAYPDTEFIAFIKPSLENFEWSGFFKAEMWNRVSLRFDAVSLANGTFSPENIVQIIKLLIAVIKGEQELPEM